MSSWIRLAAAAAIVTAGCAQGPKGPVGPDQLVGRLNAALSVTSSSQRDDALKSVAEDAADAGAADIVKRAVGGITSSNNRDDAAYTCAIKLADRGDTQAASDVAKMITSSSKQNDALAKIAKGR